MLVATRRAHFISPQPSLRCGRCEERAWLEVLMKNAINLQAFFVRDIKYLFTMKAIFPDGTVKT